MLTLHLLNRELPLLEVAPPPLSAEIEELVAATRVRLSVPPLWNGPALLATHVGPDGIECYGSDYASYLTHVDISDRRDISPFGIGCIGACLIPFAPDGRTLWTQRSSRVLEGGTWQVGVAGAVEPGERPSEAALREAREELGLALVAPVPLAVLHGEHSVGVYVVFAAPVDPETELVLDSHEVTDARWCRNPLDELDPLHPNIVPIWRALQCVWPPAAA